MKDCFSTLAFSRKTAYGRSGAPRLRIVLFSLLVYLAGCPAFAASMQETVSDCAEIVMISLESQRARFLRACFEALKESLFFES
jgi:hypothetical protein